MSKYYNGTSAYKIDEIEYVHVSDVRENIAERQEKRESKKAALSKRMRVYAVCGAVFAAALGLLFTNAMIIEKSSAVSKMQEQLTAITDENNQTALDIEKNLDLKKIEEIAINELGMKRPDKYQIVYVDVKQNDYAEVTREEEKEGFSFNIGTVSAAIGQFVEYIN